MAKLFSQATYQALDSSGAPISGAKWNFYLTGTSTRHDTFTDNALSVAHANPVVSDSSGIFAPIYLQDADYKAVLTDAADVVIQTVDPVHGAEAVDPADLDAANVFTKTTTWKHGNDVASAAGLTLGDGNIFNITGTTGITSIGTKGVGTIIVLQFDGILTLTHNATDLVLPNGLNIITAAGDVAKFEEYAAGDWRLIGYLRSTGAALVTPLPLDFAEGFRVTIGTDTAHDLDTATGVARDAVDGSNITLSTSITKQIDANWAEGTDMGGFPSALTLAGPVTYGFFLIAKPDGTVDAGWDTSATAANLLADATGYTAYLKISETLTDATPEIASNKNIYPGERVLFHPGVAKAWANFTVAGVINASHNVTSITDNGPGSWTVNLTTPFSSANYVALANANPAGTGENKACGVANLAAGSYDVVVEDSGGSPEDPQSGDIHTVAFGDQ